MKLLETVQTGDWKGEKHVPVIDAPETVKAGEVFDVELTVGKEIPHPNTTAHHIVWIKLYFQGEGEKFPAQLGCVTFDSHGAGLKGADTGSSYTEPHGVVRVKLQTSGTLSAVSYCNIHGLWGSEQQITVTPAPEVES